MYLYSHVVLAQVAQIRLQPAFSNEYIWGAIIPEIYGVAGISRSQTHLTWPQMDSLMMRYPEQRSFLQGYRVHLYLDKIDVVKMVSQAFPIHTFKGVFARYLTQDVINLLIEDYFIRSTPRRKTPTFSGKHNEILQHLGFSPDVTDHFAGRVQAYLSNHSKKKFCDQYNQLGLCETPGAEDCLSAYKQVLKNPFLTAVLLLVIKKASLEKMAMEYV